MTISGFIAYALQTWKNKPDTSTPLSAARLAHIEAGIKANSDAITKLAAAVINQQANDVNKIPSSALMYSVNEKVDSAISDLAVKNVTAHFYKNAPVSYVLAYKIGHMVQCIFTINAGASGWVEVAFCDDDVRPLMDVPVYRARSAIADDNTIQVNGTLKAAENKLYIYISKALSTNLSMSCIYPTTR